MRYAVPVAYTGAELLARQRRGEFELWPHNRAVDVGRAGQIARLMDESRDPWFLGPAPVYVAYVGDRGYILDGQHRLAALAEVEDPELFQLFLGRIYVRLPEELHHEFERINCGSPVPESYWNSKFSNVLDAFFGGLRREFPAAESRSARPRRPRYNPSTVALVLSEKASLREAVRANRLTGEHLVAAAIRENVTARALYQEGLADVPQQCLSNASNMGFFLGLDRVWPERVAQAALMFGAEEEGPTG
jgi:hypothetical protein